MEEVGPFRLRRRLNLALREVRPWPDRIELSREVFDLLRSVAAAAHFERRAGAWRYRGVPVRIRVHLVGWRVVGENVRAAAHALQRDGPVKVGEPSYAQIIESSDFDDREAIRAARSR